MGKGHGVSGHTHTQAQLDHYANQNNPNNDAYWANQDNHANQCEYKYYRQGRRAGNHFHKSS